MMSQSGLLARGIAVHQEDCLVTPEAQDRRRHASGDFEVRQAHLQAVGFGFCRCSVGFGVWLWGLITLGL